MLVKQSRFCVLYGVYIVVSVFSQHTENSVGIIEFSNSIPLTTLKELCLEMEGVGHPACCGVTGSGHGHSSLSPFPSGTSITKNASTLGSS